MTDRRRELAQRLDAVRARVATACAAVDRDPQDVHLIVVTKYFPASDIEELAALGVGAIGENRHQEAAVKVAELDPQVREQLQVHFIGQLQSNKAPAVAHYADVVQSLDRAKVARALDRVATQADRQLDVTIQIDLSGEDAGRGGVAPADLAPLCDVVAGLAGLRLRGVMAVAPLGEDPGSAFARLAQLHAQVVREHPAATWRSAGMSGDLEQAVAAGATHLRVGSAILGSRPEHR